MRGGVEEGHGQKEQIGGGGDGGALDKGRRRWRRHARRWEEAGAWEAVRRGREREEKKSGKKEGKKIKNTYPQSAVI